MSRKHFRLIAEALRDWRKDRGIDDHSFHSLITLLCHLFIQINRRFSPVKFREACDK